MVKFTKTHEWVKIENNEAIVGITDYAQSELGDIVFVELPATGSKILRESRLATLESTKAAAEVYAPLSGEVVEVNKELENSPQLVNEEPLGKGWIAKLKITEPKEISFLWDEETYKNFLEQEKK